MPNKETKSIQGVPSDFKEVAHGTHEGKPWKIYSGFVNGERVSTFDETYVGCPDTEKVFFYTEKPSKDGKFINKTLGKYEESQDIGEDPFKEEIPEIKEEKEEPNPEEEYEKEKEKEMKALEGTDDEILVKIYKVLLAIETILDRE